MQSPPTDLRSLRDLIPFAVELGIELLEADAEIVRAPQTQIYQYADPAQ